ncbi:hypothetical protein KKF91_21755, partial [Myxococcota bacterium]|nr:hypothetical protein [Myxococcota bacterium]
LPLFLLTLWGCSGGEEEAAPSCLDLCVEGAVQCNGDSLETCRRSEDGCLAWWGEPCPGGESCQGGVCGACVSTCAPGTARCEGDAVMRCFAQSAQCYIWGPAEACAAGESCSAGQCAAGCVDECAEGQTICAEGGVKACGAFDADPCRDWGPVTACAAGESCSSGACAAGCADECVEGTQVCDGDAFKRCGGFDADACTEWSELTPCGVGESCSAGACAPIESCTDECVEGVTQCSNDSAGVRACGQFDEDPCADWGPTAPCAAGETCSQGACAATCADECTAGTQICDGDAFKTCGQFDADPCDEWSALTLCAEGESCSAGECNPVAACEDECVAGGVRCSSDSAGVRRCGQFDGDACADWSPVEPCPAGQTCSQGACAATCADECVAGSRACEGDAFKSCGQLDGDACLEWSALTPCAAGETCSNGQCSATCVDECAQGALRCAEEANGLIRCGQADDDPCLDWGEVALCAAGETCSNQACAAVCSDECAAGSRRCVEGGVAQCGDFDADDCLEWSRPSPCDVGEVCAGGVCEQSCEHACPAGQRRCAEGGVQLCLDTNGDGCVEWGSAAPCDAGLICDAGACVAACSDACVAGATRCALGGLERCGDFDADACLEWSDAAPCPAGESCSNGACAVTCQDECVDGRVRCADGGVQGCGDFDADPCLEWGVPSACPQGLVCDAGACVATCSDECAAGSARCQGEGVATCGDFDADDCLEWSTSAPCAAGEICADGACAAVCTPECNAGAARCAAGGVQSCGDLAICPRWGALIGERFVVGETQPCAEGTSCSNGACLQVCQDECTRGNSECTPSGERRICGDFDPDECAEWSEPIACAQGESCSNGVCASVCQDECVLGESDCDQADSFTVCGDFDDDDCSEWGLSQPCEAGWVCQDGACVGCAAAEEVPDGVDNDCDDIIDEAPQGTLPGWCVTQFPPSLVATEGFPSRLSYGQIWAEGMSEAAGAHPAIMAEIGYGADAPGDDWAWFNGLYNVQNGFNDEYMGRLIPLERGDWSYAWRFSIDGGLTWAYCDTSDNAGIDYDAASAGQLYVGPSIWWGNLQWPYETTVAAGAETELIFGRVYQEGVTEQLEENPALLAEVGYGPLNTHPRDDLNQEWIWFEASWNGNRGNDDEYMATMIAPMIADEYAFAWRYSLDAGRSWVYADRDGSRTGYDPAMSGLMVVE